MPERKYGINTQPQSTAGPPTLQHRCSVRGTGEWLTQTGDSSSVQECAWEVTHMHLHVPWWPWFPPGILVWDNTAWDRRCMLSETYTKNLWTILKRNYANRGVGFGDTPGEESEALTKGHREALPMEEAGDWLASQHKTKLRNYNQVESFWNFALCCRQWYTLMT